jgi:integrase
MGALVVSGSYLVRHKYGYYFRIAVPKDLRPVVGLKEIRYSLRTYDGRRARPIARRMADFVHQLFDELRRGGIAVAGLSSEDIKGLIQGHVKRMLEEDEEYRALGVGPKDLEELDDHMENVSLLKSDYMEHLALSDYGNVNSHVDDLLEEQGIAVDRAGLNYKLFCREMLKAVINLLEVDIRRSQSDYSLEALPFPELLSPPPSSSSPSGQLSNTEYQQEEDQGPIFSEVVERVAAEKKATKEWTPKSEADYRAAYKLFIKIVGDLPVNQIDRKLMDSYKQTLIKLPPNMNKSPQYRDKSIEEILAMDVKRKMANETIRRNLARLNVLFNYAEDHGLIDKNPAKRLQPKKKRRDDQLRAVFDTEDLRKLFHNEKYLQDNHSRSYSFWVPILGLFTGARIDEICQLHLEDIREESGVWVFDINAKGEKKLKNPGSARLVPIHPFLLNDLKLLRYVESLRRRGETRLFPELRQRREGYGQTVSKWFGRYKRSCGVTDKDKVFHSFRHTFTHSLKQNDVNEVMISELVGHAVNSITMSRYGKRYDPIKLFEAIKKLKYNIDLSYLSKSRFVIS